MAQYIDTDTLLRFIRMCKNNGYDKKTLSRISKFVEEQSESEKTVVDNNVESWEWTNTSILLPEDVFSDEELKEKMFLVQLSNGRQLITQRLYKYCSSACVMTYIWTDNYCWYDDDEVTVWVELTE